MPPSSAADHRCGSRPSTAPRPCRRRPHRERQHRRSRRDGDACRVGRPRQARPAPDVWEASPNRQRSRSADDFRGPPGVTRTHAQSERRKPILATGITAAGGPSTLFQIPTPMAATRPRRGRRRGRSAVGYQRACRRCLLRWGCPFALDRQLERGRAQQLQRPGRERLRHPIRIIHGDGGPADGGAAAGSPDDAQLRLTRRSIAKQGDRRAILRHRASRFRSNLPCPSARSRPRARRETGRRTARLGCAPSFAEAQATPSRAATR